VDHELEVIRDQMKETSASLADKLEALENKVLGTVNNATDTVASAVDGAKEVVASVTEGAKSVVEKVSETVHSVKEALNVSHYVEQYPWISLGVSVAAGFAAAQLLPGGSHRGASSASSGNYYSQPASTSSAPRHEERNGIGGALKDIWSRVAGTVEELAVGTLMSGLKGLVSQGLPKEWQGELTRVLDETTTRLGGKVMQGNPLQELLSGQSSQQDKQHG
jgi:ElaB/YqjD/DUF883 family membrane-anchored ribosome-binding protein